MAKRQATGDQVGGYPRFDPEALRKAAGAKTYERGEAYCASGRVRIVALEAGRVTAQVFGSETYRAELGLRAGNLVGRCSCPAFSDWGFCKHLVATGLAANGAAESGEAVAIVDKLASIRAYLHGLGVEKLAQMVLQQAERDEAMLRDLELAAASLDGDADTLFAHYDDALSEACDTDGYVDYRGAGDWADGIAAVIDRIEGLIDQGHAGIVLRLLDRFFGYMDGAFERIDDSDGCIGEVIARTVQVHLAACRKAKPDPMRLARDLFDREMESDWSYFDDAYEIYRAVLGKRGRTEYRRLAEEAWSKVKPVHAGRRADEDDDGNRHRLAEIVDRFAREDNDLDMRIAVRMKSLSSPHAYLDLASLCLEHGRKPEALKWAEEGLWQFDNRLDYPLAVFTSDLYRTTGRTADAEKLLWQAFEQEPRLELHAKLKALAGKDREAAAAVTQRAVEHLNAALKAAPRRSLNSWGMPGDLLIELLQSEGRLGEAWQVVHAQQPFGCGERVLKALADASEATHPAEAMKGYAELAERMVRAMSNQAYETACRLIEQMKAVGERCGAQAAFRAHVVDVMSRHKAKRNFMKLLVARKLTTGVDSR